MAAPQLLEFTIKEQSKGVLVFDQTLDDTIDVPVTSFTINYGKIPVTDRAYSETNEITLTFGKNVKPGDKVFVNYTPPTDINRALRAPVKSGASVATIRRNAIRAFFKVQAKNLQKPAEEQLGWNEMSNLGAYADGNPYSRRDRPADPRSATSDDFIMAYGLKEAIQITNIDDADAAQPNVVRLEMAIQDACALIDSYINQSTKAGKLLVSSNRRRTSLIIARYYLDTVRRREDILRTTRERSRNWKPPPPTTPLSVRTGRWRSIRERDFSVLGAFLSTTTESAERDSADGGTIPAEIACRTIVGISSTRRTTTTIRTGETSETKLTFLNNLPTTARLSHPATLLAPDNGTLFSFLSNSGSNLHSWRSVLEVERNFLGGGSFRGSRSSGLHQLSPSYSSSSRILVVGFRHRRTLRLLPGSLGRGYSPSRRFLS